MTAFEFLTRRNALVISFENMRLNFLILKQWKKNKLARSAKKKPVNSE